MLGGLGFFAYDRLVLCKCWLDRWAYDKILDNFFVMYYKSQKLGFY